MKPILVFLSATVLTFSAKAHAQDTIYQQKVTLESTSRYHHSFFIENGVIICMQDSVIFDCKKKKEKFRVAFSYNDIKKVRGYNYLWAIPILALLPSWDEPLGCGVKIETKSERYYFSTPHRKKLLEIIKSKIAK